MVRLLWLLGSCLLLGCSSATSNVPDGTGELSVRVFLDPGLRSERDVGIAEVETAFQNVLQDCMENEGFTYHVDLRDLQEAAIVAEQEPIGRISRFIPDEAGSFGISEVIELQLDRGELAVELPDDDPNQTYFEALDKVEQAAYEKVRFGVNGCEARASEQSGINEVLEFTDLSVEIANEIGPRVEADSEFRQELDGWSTCMSEAGIRSSSDAPFGSPMELVQELEDRLFGTPPDEWDEALLAEFEIVEKRAGLASLGCGGGQTFEEVFEARWEFHQNKVLADRGLD